MVLILKGMADIKKIKNFLSDRRSKKPFDAKRVVGKLKVNEDALIIQRRLRDEWN